MKEFEQNFLQERSRAKNKKWMKFFNFFTFYDIYTPEDDFEIEKGVGEGEDNQRKDVAVIQQALLLLGYTIPANELIDQNTGKPTDKINENDIPGTLSAIHLFRQIISGRKQKEINHCAATFPAIQIL